MSDLAMDMSEFIDSFFEEADEHLRTLEEGLLHLEKSPQDTETLHSVFRSAHTIKGNSGMLGLTDIVTFTHALETLLDRMRNDDLPTSDDLVSLLLASTDGLSALVQAAKDGTSAPSATDALLQQLEAALQGPSKKQMGSEESPADSAAAMKSAENDSLEGFMEFPNEPMEPQAASFSTDSTAKESVSTAPGPIPKSTISKNNESIRVSIEKLENLINLAGELIIANSMVNQTADSLESKDKLQMDGTLSDLNRTTRQLQEQIMALRLVPIGATFRRFPRLVRDLSSLLGKQIRLELEGEETELDRQVVEEIGDPLTHLIRNAVDHAIETPEERRAVGKSEEGKVTLRAYHDGGNVIIEIVDDGRGLNTPKIQAKALERGLIRVGDTHTDEQLQALIFHPGFSTADKVTDVSGRGVGMDVVRRNIEQLKGAVTVHSTPNAGCVFRIKLPLTMAILDGLSVALGDEMLIVPLLSVIESIRPQPEQVKTVAGQGEVILVRGRPVPLIRLHRVLQLPATHTDPTKSLVVIVEFQQKLLALLVDDLLGQLQVVMKNLETNYQHVDGIAGATILGDGRVAFILDIAGLTRLAQIT